LDDLASIFTGKLFLIVGPSGSGKGTIIDKFKEKYSGFVYPVSYTTRAVRDGEVDGEVYHFVDKDEFEGMIKDDELLEYATVHGDNYYGTSKKDIVEPLKQGAVVMREVDIQGFHSIQKIVPEQNLVSVFMKAKDLDDLKRRIEMRGQISKEEMERRMESAKKEIAQSDDCDYLVINEWGNVEKCLKEVEEIVLKEVESFYKFNS